MMGAYHKGFCNSAFLERKDMKYRYCFFDLDGTVTDSAPGITHSVQYALKKRDIEPPPSSELLGFIGPPLVWSFSHFFGMNREESLAAVDAYREYYRAGGMLECTVYPGIPALLDSLRDAGIQCVLATCKPHVFANAILAHFDLLDRFVMVSGPEIDGTRNEKHEVIRHAIEELGIKDPSEILMIGDRDNDVLGAKENGIDTFGVLWGFGNKRELMDAGAVACYADADTLKLAILGKAE